MSSLAQYLCVLTVVGCVFLGLKKPVRKALESISELFDL